LDNKTAYNLLSYYLNHKPGFLKVITSEHTCGLPARGEPTQAQRDQCAKFQFNLKDPRHFVLHDVVRIEPHPARQQHLVAYTKEGDMVESYDGPEALLFRLAEWQFFDPMDEIGTHRATMQALQTTHDTLDHIGRMAFPESEGSSSIASVRNILNRLRGS
jgi:hypothetical protein